MVDVWCNGCLFYTGCGTCLVWWMSFFTHGVMHIWCGGCLVWWISGVVDVCVVDVVQSLPFDIVLCGKHNLHGCHCNHHQLSNHNHNLYIIAFFFCHPHYHQSHRGHHRYQELMSICIVCVANMIFNHCHGISIMMICRKPVHGLLHPHKS